MVGFIPGAELTLVALFPGSDVGLELASILLIFTGQAWNMTFSFHQSLRGSTGLPDTRIPAVDP